MRCILYKMKTLSRVGLILLICTSSLALLIGAAQAQAGSCTASAPPSAPILAIYVLAFDNDPASPINLTPKYTDTVQGIVNATATNNNVIAMILADLDDEADTHMLEVYN